MKKTTIAVVAAAALGLSTAALADQNQGFYAGANVGYGINSQGSDTLAAVQVLDPTASDKKTGFAWDIHAGYMFNQYIGVELGYLDAPNYKIDSTLGDATEKNSSVNLFAKGVYHFNPQWSLYGKLGVAYMMATADASIAGYTASDSDDKFKPAAGAGVGYDVNQNLTVNVGYTGLFGGTSGEDSLGNVHMFSAGVDYHF